MVKHINVNVEN